MPVLTEEQLKERRTKLPDAVQRDAFPEAKKAPVLERPLPADPIRVRMFHPDDIQSGSITCEMPLEVNGKEEIVKIVRGLATVTKAAADILESKGWIRGNEKETYE